ncbi:MAG: BatA domain-containing protein [bacterium]|nr:BatA domain-containing protein [bacterium]
MQFIYQPLTWGFLLVGVPILIHLINMLRHRRQRWAAMDFLLESYRRNRRWVLLKQWLLLAARMLAMFLLVLLLASWLTGSQWMSWVGGNTTHHYVLLDDSLSMGEVDQNQTAYDRGLQALSGLMRAISARPGQHQVTLLRWSRAHLALKNSGEQARLDAAADLMGQSVPPNPESLLERIQITQPSSLAVSPSESLELVAPLVAENTGQNAELYVVSDLRRNEFAEAESLRNQLQAISQNVDKIHVIDCGQSSGRNLSVVSVEPELEVWAAGVPLIVRFQVRNRSSVPAKNVVVGIRAVSYGEGLAKPQVEREYSGDVVDLPSVVIEQIAPGETVTRQIQVLFGVPGDHVVEVRIDDDALPADNLRWCSIEIEAASKVLLIDGDVEQSNAFYLQNVVSPGPRLATGIQAESKDASYLRDVPVEVLRAYDVVALLDVPRLDPQAITSLEAFCRDGGGIFQICGANTNLEFANDSLFRDGEGFFPGKLERIVQLDEGVEESETAVTARPHPVLAPLLMMENSPFSLLSIRRMLELNVPEGASVDLVASGPEGMPLFVDNAFGQGRVLTLLTGLTPEWSNWAQDPTFVVLTLRALGYLGSFRRPATSAAAGEPIEMVMVGQSMLPEAEVLLPAMADGVRVRLQRPIEVSADETASSLKLAIDLEGEDRDLTASLLRPGVYETWMVNALGEAAVKNHARNVPAAEGDLDRVSYSELKQNLRGVPIEIDTAEAISGLSTSSPDAIHSTLLIVLLLGLLMLEQVLAYSASYHATPTATHVSHATAGHATQGRGAKQWG